MSSSVSEALASSTRDSCKFQKLEVRNCGSILKVHSKSSLQFLTLFSLSTSLLYFSHHLVPLSLLYWFPLTFPVYYAVSLHFITVLFHSMLIQWYQPRHKMVTIPFPWAFVAKWKKELRFHSIPSPIQFPPRFHLNVISILPTKLNLSVF